MSQLPLLQHSCASGLDTPSFDGTNANTFLAISCLLRTCHSVMQEGQQSAAPLGRCLCSWKPVVGHQWDVPPAASHAAGSCKLSCCSAVGLDDLFQPKWSYNQQWCSHYWITVKAGQDDLSEGNGNPQWDSTNLPNQGPATQKDIFVLYWF